MPVKSKLTSSDWTAIKWYMQEYNMKIKQMIVWPIIPFTDKDNNVLSINVVDVKLKYQSRNKGNKIGS